jgi:hypothetical protein
LVSALSDLSFSYMRFGSTLATSRQPLPFAMLAPAGQLSAPSATVSDVLRVAPALQQQQQHCNFSDGLRKAAVHHQPAAHLRVSMSASFSNFGGLDIQQQLALQHSVSSPAAVSRAFATATSATSTRNFSDTPPQSQH